jgi:hypothetical protein
MVEAIRDQWVIALGVIALALIGAWLLLTRR